MPVQSHGATSMEQSKYERKDFFTASLYETYLSGRPCLLHHLLQTPALLSKTQISLVHLRFWVSFDSSWLISRLDMSSGEMRSEPKITLFSFLAQPSSENFSLSTILVVAPSDFVREEQNIAAGTEQCRTFTNGGQRFFTRQLKWTLLL